MSGPLDPPELQAEMAEVADLFDSDFYAAAHPTVAERNDDLLRHFCLHGWRELRKPRRDFDVWWYWSNHLDPASEDVNPLLHYVRTGRAAGLSTRPTPLAAAGTGTTLPTDRPVRRACLFAGFDASETVDESVLIYLRELGRFADVFCLYDNYLDTAELGKLRGVTTEAWAIRHGAYDFGSYSMLARDLIGWDRLSTYDEVLFANDSCFLLRPLDEVFERMSAQSCDWWGMQATKGLALTREAPSNVFSEPIPLETVRTEMLQSFEDDDVYDFHLGSYFLAFRRGVLEDPVFRRFVDSVAPQRGKLAVIQKYEIGLTHLLIGRGHVFSTFVPALYPFHPLFTSWAFELIEQGFPLLKRLLLYLNHYDVPGLAQWRDRVAALAPDAQLDVIEAGLLRTAPADQLHRSFSLLHGDEATGESPEELAGPAFVAADKVTPKRDDWWVFVVDATTHLLPENSRAILARVADDPAITKIILTRSRRVEVRGVNVVCEPLQSPAGRDHLLAAGWIFVTDRPAIALDVRAAPDLHHVVAVRRGLRLIKDGRTAGKSRRRPAPPTSAADPVPVLHPLPRQTVTALLTASDLDQVAEVAAQWPARYADAWRTGIPAHDLILAEELPADLAEQEDRLRRLLDGRRLMLLTHSESPGKLVLPPSVLDPTEVRRLLMWAEDHDAVIGVREPAGDLDRRYAFAFGEAALDLSSKYFESTSAVLRAADVLLTDHDGGALDFTVTGRPVVSFTRDPDAVAEGLLYDLDHMFPGPVCRDFAELEGVLESVFDPPASTVRQHRRVRDLMIERVDAENSARVVRRVQDLMEVSP